MTLFEMLQKLKRRQEAIWFDWRHKYLDGFYFIHINKTGGTSIKRALKLPFDHQTAREKREREGRVNWDRRFSFTVVRNPWDKVVSHYHYRVETNQNGLGDGKTDFPTWVRLAFHEKNPEFRIQEKMFAPQCDWIEDVQGELLVDFICRFEALEEDFAKVCMKINKPNIRLPHLKSSKHRDYRDYYDEESKRIVAENYERDIQRFGYTF